MRKHRIVSLFAFAALFAAPLAAQTGAGLSGVVSPQAADPGQVIALTATAFGGPVGISGPLIRDVHQGSPLGPAILGGFGIAIFTTLNPGQSQTSTWDQRDGNGNQVPPGDYWLEVQTSPNPAFFPVTIRAATTEPTLTASTGAVIGQPILMDIASPLTPSGFYIAAASFSTNVGVPLTPTQHLALDLDPVFALSFPSPNPLLFGNMQSNLDLAGGTAGNPIVMLLPPVPFLIDASLAFQAAVFGGAGLELTNALTFTIQ